MRREAVLGVGALLSWACSSPEPTSGSGGASSSASSVAETSSASSTASSSTASSSATSSAGTTTSSSGGGGATPSCPACFVVATTPLGAEPSGIFVDDQHVYWTNLSSGEVMQANKDGSASITLASSQNGPIAVFVTGGFVYWVSYSIAGVLRRTPIGGGPIDDLADAPAARELYVGTDYVWWTREPDDVQRAPIGGLGPGEMADLLTGSLLTNGLTADAAQIFWVDRADGLVKRGDYDLTNETVLAMGDQPWDIQVDGTNAYWTEHGTMPETGKVMQASKVDGSGALALASGLAGPNGIAIDADHVYWGNEDDGTVDEVPIGGGATTVLAAGQSLPFDVAVDATDVYFTDLVAGTIVRVPK